MHNLASLFCLAAFLPLIFAVWKPKPGTTWQWQIDGSEIDTTPNVAMFDVDLDAVSKQTIDDLHGKGKIVICYFCAGTYETYRDDKAKFPQSAIGNRVDGYPDEYWLDINNEGIKPALRGRLDKARDKGCDGVEPDNVDSVDAATGFRITAADQLKFNKWLAIEAHNRSLSVGLKNDPLQVKQLLPYFDWALVESCRQFDECNYWDDFVKDGKAVFGVEYRKSERPEVFCPEMNRHQFSWLQKREDLDAPRRDCLDQSTWTNSLDKQRRRTTTTTWKPRSPRQG